MIPIYRAKKIDSDEWVEGYYMPEIDDDASAERMGFEWFEVLRTMYGDHYQDISIDTNTLAIHFPNMIDKNGKKIFASLSENGVGGDLVSFDMEGIWVYKTMFHYQRGIHMSRLDKFLPTPLDYRFEVIGIHKGNKND